MEDSLVEERLLSILASLFGGLALLLSAIGIYGVVSFAIVRRTREIGIRMAIGARRSSVVWLVARHTLALAGAGFALGIPLVFAGRRYIESELFGLKGTDPAALATGMAVLAARLNPMTSVRHE